ncbi:MAG TPA: phospholipase D-like domain-containing protein [Geobacteraceae bacterium]|nr:phospholipase D-like domain-containing protein [Geobacteraceae bacterium]
MKRDPPSRGKPACAVGRWTTWFVALFLLLTVGTVHAGGSFKTTTTLLRNQEYAEALLNGIGNARESILCSFYLFKITETRNNQPARIAKELVTARKRGVAVTVILENSGKERDPLNADNHQTASYLIRGGVRVIFDSPRVTTHNKVVVIDNRYLYLGSHNLTQGALRYNNELSVLIDSPEMTAEVRAYLERE